MQHVRLKNREKTRLAANKATGRLRSLPMNTEEDLQEKFNKVQEKLKEKWKGMSDKSRQLRTLGPHVRRFLQASSVRKQMREQPREWLAFWHEGYK